jgi:hypothetical protein
MGIGCTKILKVLVTEGQDIVEESRETTLSPDEFQSIFAEEPVALPCTVPPVALHNHVARLVGDVKVLVVFIHGIAGVGPPISGISYKFKVSGKILVALSPQDAFHPFTVKV